MKRNDDPPDDDTGVEALGDEFFDILEAAGLDPAGENAVDAVDKLIAIAGRSYMEGYRQGQSDEAEAIRQMMMPAAAEREQLYKENKK